MPRQYIPSTGSHTKRVFSPQEKQRIYRMYKEDQIHMKQIARHYGTYFRAIQAIIKELENANKP